MAGWTTVAPGVESWESESFGRLAGKILSISLPISFLGLAAPLVNQADSAMIPTRLMAVGVSQDLAKLALGYVGNASQLRDLPLIFAQALYISLVPAVSESVMLGRLDQARNRAAAAMRLTWLIGLPATVGLAVAAKDAYGVLFGGPGWYVLPALAWSTVFLMLQQTSAGVLQGLGLVWLTVANQLVGVLVKIVLTYWWVGIPGLGVNGAAWATTVGFLISCGLNLWAMRKHFGLAVDLQGNVIRPLLAALIMGGVIYLVSPIAQAIVPWSRLAGVVTIGVGGLVFAIAILLLGGVREDDLKMIPKVSGPVIRLLNRLHLLRK